MSKESNEKLLKCVFCGAEIGSRTQANNPVPLVNDPSAVACSKCNARFVVPARERLLRALNEEREQVLEIVTKERKRK